MCAYVIIIIGSRSPRSNTTKASISAVAVTELSVAKAAFPRVGVVSAQPADTPPAFESREYCSFFQDFDSLFYVLAGFFYHSNLAGWLITHFSVV